MKHRTSTEIGINPSAKSVYLEPVSSIDKGRHCLVLLGVELMLMFNGGELGTMLHYLFDHPHTSLGQNSGFLSPHFHTLSEQ